MFERLYRKDLVRGSTFALQLIQLGTSAHFRHHSQDQNVDRHVFTTCLVPLYCHSENLLIVVKNRLEMVDKSILANANKTFS